MIPLHYMRSACTSGVPRARIIESGRKPQAMYFAHLSPPLHFHGAFHFDAYRIHPQWLHDGLCQHTKLRGRELNPGLPRDRRKY